MTRDSLEWKMVRGARPAVAKMALIVALALAGSVGCSTPATEVERLGGPVPETTTRSSDVSTTPESTTPESTTPERPGPGVEIETAAPGSTIVSGLETPWDVDFLPDGAALVTLRDSGQVLRLDSGRTTLLDAGGPDGTVPDVRHESEDGLLGLAVGPDEGVYLYLTTDMDNRVVRYDLIGDALVDPEVILAGIPAHRTHAGGRLAFGPDGYLYVTTGDARELDLPQDTDSLAGKILRVTTTGAPAPGNPFGNEIWSYGHRNVQGIGWTDDGRMFASEFGSGDFDELNLIEPGGNYGWPHIEGWAGDPDYVDPLVTWSVDEASPSGIAVTDDGVWLAALRGERLWFVPFGADGDLGEPRDYRLGLGRLRTVVATPTGELWVVTSNTDGRGEPSELDDQIVRIDIS